MTVLTYKPLDQVSWPGALILPVTFYGHHHTREKGCCLVIQDSLKISDFLRKIFEFFMVSSVFTWYTGFMFGLVKAGET